MMRALIPTVIACAVIGFASAVLSPSPSTPKVLSRVCVQTKRTSDGGATFFLTTGIWMPIYSDTCVRWVPQSVVEP